MQGTEGAGQGAEGFRGLFPKVRGWRGTLGGRPVAPSGHPGSRFTWD